MTPQEVGDLGIIVAGLGIVAFSLLFLTCVRWWTDWLGRSIAAVTAVPAVILGLSVWRLLGGDLIGGVQVWRATLFPLMGVVIWVATGVFLWAQFIAPRIKRKKEKLNA